MTTLFCSKSDSSDAGWLESESARILNTPSQYAMFKRERIEWIREDGDDDQGALPLYRQIVSCTASNRREWRFLQSRRHH